jgi:hypothetical protein
MSSKRLTKEGVKNEITDILEGKICPYYNKYIYVLFTVSIILNLLIIISLINIEKINCNCANIPEKKFIKEWFIFNIIFNITFILFFIFSNKKCYHYMFKNTFLYVITNVIFFITMVMIIRMLVYLNILRKGCECGFGNLEKFLFWYLAIIISLLIFLIVIGIIIILFGIIKLAF